MNIIVNDMKQVPESYSPKKMPEILTMAQASAFQTDTITDPFEGGEPPRRSNRILNYRRISNWENYFLASAICSIALATGADEETLKQIGNTKVNGGFHFFSAITGDMFSILYSKDKPCDSGVTNYFFVPQVVKKAYATFGYDCTYISNGQIQKDYHAVMNAIRRSIDKGIPVLAWGMGNVTMGDGNRYDPLPEGCLIGGYDENDLLYVNLYPGQERMTVDDDGYTAISNGLDTTKGLFFLGEPIEKPHMGDIYRRAIEAIPAFLTLPATDAYLFGKDAFYSWADTILEEERFIGKNDDQLNEICWDLHCSPYCNLCTSTAEAFIRAGAELYEIPLAIKLLPLYEQLTVLRLEIWALHGDFFPSMDKFRNREFRMMIADRLRQMGNICEDIVKAFDGSNNE